MIVEKIEKRLTHATDKRRGMRIVSSGYPLVEP